MKSKFEFSREEGGNIVINFACRPGESIRVDEKMFSKLSSALYTAGRSLSCTFPDILNSINGEKSDYELVTSSKIRPLLLFYTHNIARKSIGKVFV